MPPDPDVEAWITALQERHRRDLTTPEFLRAVRALSARYVESRSRLDRGRAADTPGKRAAFAAFYAPLHYFTVRAIVDALGATAPALDPLLDVGCGTGAASAAWATVLPGARIAGVDRDPWMPTEAHWTWRQMGLRGAARTGDAVRALAPLPSARRRVRRPWGCVLAWTANELAAGARQSALDALVVAGRQGAAILVVEPIARSVTPWWPEWESALTPLGSRSDEWRLPARLPPVLTEISRAAGFDRETLTARSLFLGARTP